MLLNFGLLLNCPTVEGLYAINQRLFERGWANRFFCRKLNRDAVAAQAAAGGSRSSGSKLPFAFTTIIMGETGGAISPSSSSLAKGSGKCYVMARDVRVSRWRTTVQSYPAK